MYIKNVEDIKNTYDCTPFVGKWLIEKSFPVLSISNGRYYFSDTELLREVLSTIPIWIKVINIF